MGRLTALALAGFAVIAGAAPAQTVVPVPFTTIERQAGPRTGYDSRRFVVVRSERRWRQVWRRLHRPDAVPRRPVIDFTTRVVVAVLHGPGQVGSRLRVARVERTARRVTVRTRERAGGPNACSGGFGGNPYEVVSIPRMGLPITVRRKVEDRSCE